MASKSPASPTNERIVQMLAEVQRQLAAAEERDRRLAADIARLQKTR